MERIFLNKRERRTSRGKQPKDHVGDDAVQKKCVEQIHWPFRIPEVPDINECQRQSQREVERKFQARQSRMRGGDLPQQKTWLRTKSPVESVQKGVKLAWACVVRNAQKRNGPDGHANEDAATAERLELLHAGRTGQFQRRGAEHEKTSKSQQRSIGRETDPGVDLGSTICQPDQVGDRSQRYRQERFPP